MGLGSRVLPQWGSLGWHCPGVCGNTRRAIFYPCDCTEPSITPGMDYKPTVSLRVGAELILSLEFVRDRKNNLVLVERIILLSGTCNLSRGLGS